LRDKGLFRFEGFRLDVGNRRLEKDGAVLPLTADVFDTLVLLVRAFPDPVSRNEFRAAPRPDGAVEESVREQSICVLRKALGSRPDGSQYIETLPERGFRFTVEPDALSGARDRRKRLAVGGAILLLALTVIGWWRSRPHAPRPEAVRRYRQGMATWKQRAAMDEAERDFREAVRVDPEYADAHAGLAAVRAFQPYPARGAAEEAALAIVLDPRSSLAYAVRGFVHMVHEWNWDAAERDLRRAAAMNPADPTAVQWYALLLTLRGHPEEGLWRLDEALAREPASANLLSQRCDLLYFDRLYRDAIQSCEAALRVNAGLVFARERLVYLYAAIGEWDQAAEEVMDAGTGGPGAQRGEWAQRFRTAIKRNGPAGFWGTLADLYVEQGRYPYYMAIAASQLQDRAAALDHIDKAVAAHDFPAFSLGAEPALAGLHDDPRFQAACRTVGVPCR
jgi:DNA-binding winged helix-turn-helix (wHTH) protein/Tfp pilus assembly protein PilF